MARKLKTYQTSLGFFDLAIAAPSMKAALQAWSSETNLSTKALQRKPMIPHSLRPRSPNLASFCGARSDRMARSANMPSCEGTPHRQGEGGERKASSDKRTAG
jgi:hypothetical protein